MPGELLRAVVFVGSWVSWNFFHLKQEWHEDSYRKITLFPVLIFSLINLTGTLLTVCHYHITYAYQSESTFCGWLNVNELLAQNRQDIWKLRECIGTRTQNHIGTLNHLAKHTQSMPIMTSVYETAQLGQFGQVFVFMDSWRLLMNNLKGIFRNFIFAQSLVNNIWLCFWREW